MKNIGVNTVQAILSISFSTLLEKGVRENTMPVKYAPIIAATPNSSAVKAKRKHKISANSATFLFLKYQ